MALLRLPVARALLLVLPATLLGGCTDKAALARADSLAAQLAATSAARDSLQALMSGASADRDRALAEVVDASKFADAVDAELRQVRGLSSKVAVTPGDESGKAGAAAARDFVQQPCGGESGDGRPFRGEVGQVGEVAEHLVELAPHQVVYEAVEFFATTVSVLPIVSVPIEVPGAKWPAAPPPAAAMTTGRLIVPVPPNVPVPLTVTALVCASSVPLTSNVPALTVVEPA